MEITEYVSDLHKKQVHELWESVFYYDDKTCCDIDSHIDYIIDDASSVESASLFVAVDSDKVLGTVAVAEHGCNSSVIYMLAVDEDYRGRGIGCALLNYAEKYIKDNGIYNITLFTKQHNIGFFNKAGYSSSEYIEMNKKLSTEHIA